MFLSQSVIGLRNRHSGVDIVFRFNISVPNKRSSAFRFVLGYGRSGALVSCVDVFDPIFHLEKKYSSDELWLPQLIKDGL